MTNQSCAAQHFCRPTEAQVELRVPDEVWKEWGLWEDVAIREKLIERGTATPEELDALGLPTREAVEQLVRARHR
jgi:hypothetical protein